MMMGTGHLGRLRNRAAVPWLALLAGLAIATEEPAVAAGSPGQVWLLSTRQAPWHAAAEQASQRIGYWRLSADNAWGRSDFDELLATDSAEVPTIVYLHGNRAGENQAVTVGSLMNRHLVRAASGRPFRLIIWSWPADRIRGTNRRDSQIKAARSDVEAYYLARFLAGMDPEVRVGLVGHSFGVRAIAGALHILGGGRLAGRTLGEDLPGQRRPVRVVMVAAAIDAQELLPGQRYARAMSQIEQVLLTTNRCDLALRLYCRLYTLRRGPSALGLAGPACPLQLGAAGEKIERVNVSCWVGRPHGWCRYLTAPNLVARLGWYAFLEPEATDEPGASR